MSDGETNRSSPNTMSSAPVIDYQDSKSQSDKFLTKVKKNPMVPIGVIGMAGMVGYGIYNYRNRGGMSTSFYLMQLRVKAQSMVVGALTLGITYSLVKDYLKKNKTDDAKAITES